MSAQSDWIMNDADVERIRSVLDRLVDDGEDSLSRITFENGEVFTLKYIADIEEESDPISARDLVGAWSGSIVAAQNLEENRRKLFVPGSGIIFAGSEIAMIEDELTGEILYSRAPDRL